MWGIRMDGVTRALEIQRRCRITEYAEALAALVPAATEAEKQYLRDMVRRDRAARHAKTAAESQQRSTRHA